MSLARLSAPLGALALLSTASTGLAQTAQDSPAMQKLEALDAKVNALFAAMDDTSAGTPMSSLDRLTIAGYGEYHGNFVDDGTKIADPHRFVMFFGYDFGDGILLFSETELEHGFVKDGDGQISLEQLYIDITVGERSSIQIGRLLTPLGIINQRHEPTFFNGVERPNLEKFLIPSTWSQDGIGLLGEFSDNLTYEVQLTSGLDGAGFEDIDGIRGGRLKERPALSDPAVSGRIDWRPDAVDNLRIGVSAYSGGAGGGDQDADVGVDAAVDILSLDFEYALGDFDFRGVLVDSKVKGADDLNNVYGNNVGSRQAGSYLEAAYHIMDRSERDPNARFPEQDLVAFVRLEQYDTIDEAADGGFDDPLADREEVTIGIGWWLTPKVVIKADYQDLGYADSSISRADQVNIGIGWTL